MIDLRERKRKTDREKREIGRGGDVLHLHMIQGYIFPPDSLGELTLPNPQNGKKIFAYYIILFIISAVLDKLSYTTKICTASA